MGEVVVSTFHSSIRLSPKPCSSLLFSPPPLALPLVSPPSEPEVCLREVWLSSSMKIVEFGTKLCAIGDWRRCRHWCTEVEAANWLQIEPMQALEYQSTGKGVVFDYSAASSELKNVVLNLIQNVAPFFSNSGMP